ncbi:MAG: hypothetical protein IJ889_00285 [Eubacterium sp.]|nr:hypothetical protein [Eubacterium sp.]MBR2247287.1 hypothetical protein [Bacilli bacterium]
MKKIAMFGDNLKTENRKRFQSFIFGDLELIANCSEAQLLQIAEKINIKQYAKEMADYITTGNPMKTIIVFDDDRALFGTVNDEPFPYCGIMNSNGMNNSKYVNIAKHSNPFIVSIMMSADSYFKKNMGNDAELIYRNTSYGVWYYNSDIEIDGQVCSEELHRIICELVESHEEASVKTENPETKKSTARKTEEGIDVNPEELKPDDSEEKKVETPNAAPVVICLPVRDDAVEVKLPKTPPVKSGPEAATPDSVELDPPKTVETKVTEPRVTNVQNMTVVENTDGYHLYSQDIAYDASVMYGAEITNCPKPPADKIIAQNRATLREYFLKRGLVRKTKKGYAIKYINFDKKKTEMLELNDVLSRAQTLQDQLRKISKQCEIYITPREFLMSTAEDEATVNAIDIYRKYYNLNMKDPASMIPYLNKGVPNNYVIDVVCYDDAGAVFKPYCITIDFLGCIEKYKVVDGQKVEGDRIPQIYVGASLIFDGEEISNLYFGKEKDNNCIIMKVPCTLNNIDSLFRQIGKGYCDSIEEDYPLMKDAKAPKRELELKQKVAVPKKLTEQINEISAQIAKQKASIGELQRQQLPEVVTNYYRH